MDYAQNLVYVDFRVLYFLHINWLELGFYGTPIYEVFEGFLSALFWGRSA